MYGKGFGRVGRPVAGVAWAALLLGLWLWGHDTAEGLGGVVPVTGDVAAVGRPPAHPLPPAREPLPPVRARRVVVESAGIAAQVTDGDRGRGRGRGRGAGRHGVGRRGVGWYGVGWYGVGARPGAPGTAVLVGPADAGVVRRLGGVRRGDAVRVWRADGTVAEFTVEGVEMVTAEWFDARRVFGARARGRAELRLVARGGQYGAHGARVVVSAYLTGIR
ncbi:class F sortase [Streptomyces sp. ME19-01-6]|uniref:class F sortase n=1 Tax=Streptomyces sp. ME19-01-6 TaxID=3028686 RepID=UPI0029B4A335|nr:class F sortase [Streptomyces sp. ME19-01-6]MDX3233253.1 class F sortase [Streptomyces sp. ME19-01-6]